MLDMVSVTLSAKIVLSSFKALMFVLVSFACLTQATKLLVGTADPMEIYFLSLVR